MPLLTSANLQDAVARRAAVQSEISSVLRPFYCEVCEKQFQNVAQYDEHTNSYAHHHKVRFRDMQLAQRASRNTEEEINKRKEKERKREEKELRKIAKAAGVKMVKPPVAIAAVAESPSASSAVPGGGFKKSGWATVTTPTANASSAPAEPPKQSGRATVGDAQQSSSSSGGKGGWAPVSASAGPTPAPPSESVSASTSAPSRVNYTSAPAFRTGGWTSLETSDGGPPPPNLPYGGPPPPPPAYSGPPSAPSYGVPPPPPASIPAPPPTSNEPLQGWVSVPPQPRRGGWNAVPPANAPPPSVAPAAPNPALATFASRPPPPAAPAAPAQEASRSGWQKFRAGAPGRRR